MNGNGKMATIKQFDVYLVNLDPTIGYEMKKSRPCVIISSEELNILKTVIIAPMTTVRRNFPFRVNLLFDNKKGQVALDQIRCIDKGRLNKKLGTITESESNKICDKLVQMFSK